jgi:hypothetical protein
MIDFREPFMNQTDPKERDSMGTIWKINLKDSYP